MDYLYFMENKQNYFLIQEEAYVTISFNRLKDLSLPCNEGVRDLMLEALEKILLPLEVNEEKRLVSDIIKTKNMVLKQGEELKDEVIKFINMKDVSC